jgi:hypothetical protein
MPHNCAPSLPYFQSANGYENAAECPDFQIGNECCDSKKIDSQDIPVLNRIFAEAGKPRLSVKPRPLGRGASLFSLFLSCP